MSPLKGKTKGRGREGRQHVHLIAEEDRDKPGTSGFPDHVDSHRFHRSSPCSQPRRALLPESESGLLTPDDIPPEAIIYFQSLKTQKKYDRGGTPL